MFCAHAVAIANDFLALSTGIANIEVRNLTPVEKGPTRMASIEEDIVEWGKTRSPWQQNLISKIARGEVIDDAYLGSIAQGIVDASIVVTAPLTVADIPTSGGAGAKVEILSIGELVGVNALEGAQTLTFGATGLTAVYGDNGSGKSGFARLAKELVGARHSEPILNDAYATTASAQSASISYQVDGASLAGVWPNLSDGDLRRVHFYDEACGDDYLVSETELSFRPSVLKIFDELIARADQIRGMVDDLIVTNSATRFSPPALAAGTKAQVLLSGLSSKTKPGDVTAFLTLDGDADSKLGDLLREEARLKSTDPAKEKQRLQTAAANLETLADHFDSIAKLASPEAGKRVLDEQGKLTELRSAATAASATDFADEPLSGVGSDAWRALWEAAQRFSEEDAYPKRDFPATEATDHCVLCQQPLQAEGQTRLSRFHAFVHNDLEKQAKEAEGVYRASLTGLRDFVLSTVDTTAALAFLAIESRELAADLKAALEKAQEAKDRIAARLEADSEEPFLDLAVVDSKSLRELAGAVRARGVGIDDTAFKQSLADTTAAKEELSDLIQLSKSQAAVLDEITRLIGAAKLQSARTSLSTAPMTTKSAELARKYVTKAVSDRFVRESERLRLDRVILGDRGGAKGKLRHRPALLGAGSNSPTDVLSEGEQTAAGLAGLFTEVMFDDAKSAIFLDDPVSSLDHERRDKTATRVVELAKDRQVVVFTHDLMFLGELVKAAVEQGVPLTERAIERDGDGKPGHVIEGYPWKAKDAKSRLADLQGRLDQLNKSKPSLDSEEYELRSSDWAGRLSETWERLVRSEIVNQVVDRGTTEVKPRMFKLLAKITEEDDKDFQTGYSAVSKWARRHDKSEEVSYTAPTIEELQAELDRAFAWYKRIVTYKN